MRDTASDEYQHPLSIRIPVPYEEPRHTGIHSTKHPDSSIAYARLNRFETILIDQVCKDLGMKTGTFLRFCAVHVAQELEKAKNDYLKSHQPR